MDNNFVCFRCGYNYHHKQTVKNHLKKIKECDPNFSDTSRAECLKLLDLKKTDYKDRLIKLMLPELLKVKAENEELKNKMKNIQTSAIIDGDYNNNVNSSINSNNTNNFNITINNYADTDYSVLMQEENLNKCVKENGEFNFDKFISLLHFNPKFPQNHNLVLSNKKEKIVAIYSDGMFEQYGKGYEGLKKILKEKLDYIETNPDKFDVDLAESSYTLKDDVEFGNFSEVEEKKILYDDVFQPLLNGTERINVPKESKKEVKRGRRRVVKNRN